jgi:predicted metal-dependent peptidase
MNTVNNVPTPVDSTAPAEKQGPMEPTSEEIEFLYDVYQGLGAEFVQSHPFYGHLLLQLALKPSGEELPTAAVNYRNLFICALNKARCEHSLDWANLSKVAKKTVLAHEILHLVFEHLGTPSIFNKEIANIAKDAVINRSLMGDSAFNLDELPRGCVTPLRDDTGFTLGWGTNMKTFKIPKFKESDWLPIYKKMMEQLESECKGDRQKLEDTIKKLAGMNPMQGDCEGNPDDGDTIDGESSSLQQEMNRFRIQVQDAVEVTKKTQGFLPGGVEAHLGALHSGKISWRDKLRQLIMTETSRDDFSWKMNSRRMHLGRDRSHPGYFPTVWNECLGDVVLVLDTSGSMSHKELVEGLSEFRNMREQMPFNVHFITCDAEVHDYVKYEKWDTEIDWENLPVHGRGGSSFVPAFEFIDAEIEKGMLNPAIVCFFTDGYITFVQEKPEYPVICMSTQANEDSFPEYAQVIIMEDY